jgi:hypothetical protein
MIKLRTVIEIAGFPKEHIEETMQRIVANLKQDKDVVVLNAVVSETTQVKTMWSVFSELELEFNTPAQMLNFCFDYTPSYVEVFEPVHLEIAANDFSSFINDLLGRLHQHNVVMTNLNAENIILKKKLGPENKENTPQKEDLTKKLPKTSKKSKN